MVRSQAEAQEAGNMVADGDHIAGWDSQFFIYSKEAIPQGKKLRITMKVRADIPKAGAKPSAGTQARNKPGNYHHWQCIGNVEFTNEWKDFEWEGEVASQWVNGDGTKTEEEDSSPLEFHSIAFNLADYRDGYTAYFDNIKMEIMDQKEPGEFTGWFNLIFNGDLSTDENFQYTYKNPAKAYTYTSRNGIDNKDIPSPFVKDPIDDQTSLTVKSNAFNYEEEVPETDENGDPILDEEGNPTYKTNRYFINEETGDTLKSIDDWRTQFFVATNHVFQNDVKPANGIIYNLTGRRMNKAVKGLYIMDGKKYFKK